MSEIHEMSGGGGETAEGREPEGSRWAKAHHVLLYFLAGGAVVWLLTGIYRVDANEVAIVERLGQYVTVPTRIADAQTGAERWVEKVEEQRPGQHYGMPWPFDIIHRVPKQAQTVEVRDFSEAPPEVQEYKNQLKMQYDVPQAVLDSVFDPYLITSDKNVLNAKATVQYQINNVAEYLQSMSHPGRDATQELEAAKTAIRQVAKHVMIQEVAKTPVDSALREGKQELMNRIALAMQPQVEKLHLGIAVSTVTMELKNPAQVNEAFQAVAAAMFGARTATEEAGTYADKMRTSTETGKVAEILGEARSYRDKTVQEAKAEAARFQQLFQRYKKAPDVTKLALYTDAVNAVLGNVTRTMFVPRGEATTVVLDPTEEKTDKPRNQTPPR